MKRSRIFILIAAMAAMSSCLVSSLNPFYKNEDKIYDPVMLGEWLDGDSARWTIEAHTYSQEFMGPVIHDSSYTITFYEEEGKKSVLRGTLFRLNGMDYVDFTPDPDEDHCIAEMSCWHHVPVHTLARVQYCADSIMLYWYGEEWLNELFEEKRIRIKHEKIQGIGYDRHLLTARTKELQKFIRKFANDPKTAEEVERTFATGESDDKDDAGLFIKLKKQAI